MFKDKILLILHNQKNSLLLKEFLQENYQIYEGSNKLDFETNFDLCIIDGIYLEQYWENLKSKKHQEKPLFLPVILLSQRSDINLSTRNLWQLVEDVILLPIGKKFFLAKIENLLQTRRLSWQLRLTKNQIIELKNQENNREAKITDLGELSNDLETAINQKELLVYYQPIVNLSNNKLIGFEALARWIHPTLGFIPPEQFIPLAIDINKIREIDLLILEKATSQMKIWQSQGLFKDDLSISVNISAQCFMEENLVSNMKNILDKTGFNPCQIKMEITERNVLAETAYTLKKLEELKELGLELWLDDFGTGYSSMSYLHFFPLNGLKIDKSFVQTLEQSQKTVKLVELILTLASDFNLAVIAEGIETETQLQQIKLSGCQYGQGYWFSKPLSPSQVIDYLPSGDTAINPEKKAHSSLTTN